MTKAEAVAEWRQLVLPAVKAAYEQDGIPDYPARCEAWNNYTDALCKDGRITPRQYDAWVPPAQVRGWR